MTSDKKISARQKLIRYGSIIGLVGFVLVLILPGIFNAGIRSQMKLVQGGEMFKNWMNLPLPVTTKFHFFHVMNPEEAMNGAKVKLREVGPFVFEQWRRKEIIEWGPRQESVKYFEYKKFLYKPDLSQGSWDEEIVTINPVVAGLAAVLDDTIKTVPLVPTVVSPFLYTVVSGVLMAHGHNLFLKTTPRQLLLGHRINIFDTVQSILEPLEVFGIKAEDLMPTEDMPNNAFGILNGKNNTKSGPYEVWTGVGDQEKYGYFISWKNEKKMNKWSKDECNRIIGTDGSSFPPFRTKDEKLPIFGPDICRTLYLVYDKDDEFMGIPVWRMKLDPKLWETPKVNPENECYCAHKKRPDRCNIKGLVDLAGCLQGAPLVMTAPHFLNTEPNLASLVEGLTPDPEKHGFEVLFEPRLGAPVYARGRIQLSVRVEKTSFLRGFSDVKNAFVPFVWVEEGGNLDDFLGMVLKIALVYVIDGSQKLAMAMTVIGWLVAFAAFSYGILCPSKRKQLYPRDEYTPRKMSIDSRSDDEEVTERLTGPSVTTVLKNKFLEMKSTINGAVRRQPPLASDIVVGSDKYLKKEPASNSNGTSSSPNKGELHTVYTKRSIRKVQQTHHSHTSQSHQQTHHVAFAEQVTSHGERAALVAVASGSTSPPPVEDDKPLSVDNIESKALLPAKDDLTEQQ